MRDRTAALYPVPREPSSPLIKESYLEIEGSLKGSIKGLYKGSIRDLRNIYLKP